MRSLIVSVAGMVVIAVLIALVANFGETSVLRPLISGIEESADLTVEEWVKQFADLAMLAIGAALVAAILWYVWAEYMAKIDYSGRTSSRPIWILLMVIPIVAAEYGCLKVPAAASGAWLAYAFLWLNAIFTYWLATAMFSPSRVKTVVVMSDGPRALRERMPL